MLHNPKLIVHMVTYNHEKYIAQAIESVVMQKTNFTIKLLIGEDCSTDNTRNIIKEYADRYPDIIIPFYREKNLGASKNGILLFTECKSEYLATLDGDDYWTDPYKLQKQVDFLDANPGFSMCFHDVEGVDENGVSLNTLFVRSSKDVLTFRDLIFKHYVPLVSCVFRNNISKWDFNKLDKIIIDDLLHLLNAEYGNAKYMNEVMGAYRIHSGGTWSSLSIIDRKKTEIHVRKNIYDYYRHNKYKRFFAQSVGNYYFSLANYCLENGERSEGLRSYVLGNYFFLKGGKLEFGRVITLINILFHRV
jgi:glycosyltransferase involved in cell wall biosynthesis